MLSFTLRASIEKCPLASAFTISRGAKTEAVVVVAEAGDGTHTGRGECVPYARYNETPEAVAADIEAMKELVACGLSRDELIRLMPAGAARNALDCAMWDLEAKQSGKPAYEIAGLPEPKALVTAFTISLDTVEAMATAAAKAADWPLLKIKLGADGVAERLAAVRKAAPRAELIVDANEAWTPANLDENYAACAANGVTMIEQPLPAGQDDALAAIKRTVPVCADESLQGNASLTDLARKYDALNIKLDKTGGLTEALALVEEATHMGFTIMAGCMVATSLAIAPALLFAQKAKLVDLDGPLWLEKDRDHGLIYKDHRVQPGSKELWG